MKKIDKKPLGIKSQGDIGFVFWGTSALKKY